ncbi:MAG: universal stress protein [Burkholderiales bacterium]
MYRHILLPTDGSALSRSAVESGIRLAKTLDAKITGLHVVAKFAATSLDARMRDATTRTRLKAMFAEQVRRGYGVSRSTDMANVFAELQHERLPLGIAQLAGQNDVWEALRAFFQQEQTHD